MLQSLFKRLGGDREKFSEMERELKMQRLLEQKQKNSNERELERYHEEERQKQIKRELDIYRKQRTKELWSHNMLKAKNVFRGGKTLLHQDKSVLNDGNVNLMKRGNLI